MTTSQLERATQQSPKVTMTAVYGEATEYKPDMPNNWRVTLHYQGRQFTTNFYGGALVNDISAADVLSSLILDATLGEQDFEDFCADLGYDADSRKAERDWKACRAEATKVRRFLGADFDRFASLEH